jgi:hypothetical protein
VSTERRVGWSLAAVSALLWVVFAVLFAFGGEALVWVQSYIFMTAFPLMFASSFVLASARRAETRAHITGDD